MYARAPASGYHGTASRVQRVSPALKSYVSAPAHRHGASKKLGGQRSSLAVSYSQTPHAASDVQSSISTPHSGYHYDGTPRRFFEGWYWKVTIPELNDSFALIYSVEDPHGGGEHAGVGVQVMGPGDGYICQFSRDTSSFWAARNELALGTTFMPHASSAGNIPASIIPAAEFTSRVERGFQATTFIQQGSIIANEVGAAGRPLSTVGNCSWSITLQPVYGWGDSTARNQKATAGWLSVLSVFEPHWQVLMSHGLASGWFQWGGQRYEFTNAPSYAEKNWGGGFPSKWHWVQCNTFDGHPNLSVTAVGARRALLLGAQGLGLGEEDVGLIGVSWEGRFIELVPWNAELEWDVDPWGRWYMRAVGSEYEAVLEATCTAEAGTVLRAPTIAQGLAPFCKDTFKGQVRLRIWQKGTTSGPPLLDATSSSGALEVGGGPWWSAWSAKAAMKEPFRTLVQLPIDVKALGSIVPQPMKPPGL